MTRYAVRTAMRDIAADPEYVVSAPSQIDAARALRFRLWLGAHYYGKGK